MIKKEDIQKIKDAIDPLEIYSRYLNLKKVGSNWFGCCPFHGEKIPSLSIAPNRNYVYKCFGCGVGGDFIDFYRKTEGISFVESCLNLAKEFDIKIELDKKLAKEIKSRDILQKINSHIATFYNDELAKNMSAIEYLADVRKISPTMIKTFKIGATNKNNLNKIFQKYESLTKKLGLVTENNHDFFRDNRLMFPIQNEYGKIIGFNSRAIPQQDGPKYLNSRESELFDKKEALYGINFALKEIKARKSVFITEGIFDVIRMHQVNIKNCVGINGLSIHEPQIKKLAKYAKRFFLCLDNDKAALERMESVYLEIKKYAPFVDIRVVELPDCGKKMDVDEFIRENGATQFIYLVIDKDTKKTIAKPYNEYVISKALRTLNYSNIDEKRMHIYLLKDHLNAYDDYKKKNRDVELLASKLNIDENEIWRVLNKEKKDTGVVLKSIEKREIVAQKYIVALLLSDFGRNFILSICEEKDVKKYLNNTYNKLFNYISKKLLQDINKSDIINELISKFENEKSKNLIADIIFKSEEISGVYEESEIIEFLEDNLHCLKHNKRE